MVVKFIKGWMDEVADLSVTVSPTGTREEGGGRREDGVGLR